MVMTTARYPVAPTTERLRGTLIDATGAEDGIEWQDGLAAFDSYNCMKFEGAANFCAPNSKTFDNTPVWQSGFRIAAYGGVTCGTVGFDSDRAMSEVERVFQQGESTAVERALMDIRFKAPAGDNVGRWTVPTDITPASGAVKPALGVAMLEGHAASEYVGVPTLHLPRSIASLLVGVDGATFEGDVLRTKLGSKIAAGAGYDYPNLGPTGAAAAAGEKWLYATGEVLIQRGALDVRDAVDMEQNDVYVLAERAYIITVDCYAAAIRVTETA